VEDMTRQSHGSTNSSSSAILHSSSNTGRSSGQHGWSKSISYSMSGLVSAQMGDCLAGIPSRRRNKHPGLLSVSLYPMWAGGMST